MTLQVKATQHYFPVVLFIVLYKVVLTFESVDEILECDPLGNKLNFVTTCYVCRVIHCVTETRALIILTNVFPNNTFPRSGDFIIPSLLRVSRPQEIEFNSPKSCKACSEYSRFTFTLAPRLVYVFCFRSWTKFLGVTIIK